MNRAALVMLALLAGCAMFKSVARTALDVAREACDVFLAQQPEADRALGMTLDQCADQLLAAQRQTMAARRLELQR